MRHSSFFCKFAAWKVVNLGRRGQQFLVFAPLEKDIKDHEYLTRIAWFEKGRVKQELMYGISEGR